MDYGLLRAFHPIPNRCLRDDHKVHVPVAASALNPVAVRRPCLHIMKPMDSRSEHGANRSHSMARICNAALDAKTRFHVQAWAAHYTKARSDCVLRVSIRNDNSVSDCKPDALRTTHGHNNRIYVPAQAQWSVRAQIPRRDMPPTSWITPIGGDWRIDFSL
jgi:hypothetical protein